MKSRVCLWIVLILLVVTLSLADRDTSASCVSDTDCGSGVCNLFSPGGQCYCRLGATGRGTCFVRDSTTIPPAVTPPVVTTSLPGVNLTEVNRTLEEVKQKVGVLETRNIGLEQRIATVETTVEGRLTALESNMQGVQQQTTNLDANLNTLNGQVTQLQGQLQQVDTQQNQLSTGLAGLQQNLDLTKSDLENVEKDLARRKAITTVLIYVFLVLLVIGIALVLIHYLTRSVTTVSPEVVRYITSHIKEGKKYPQIKEALLKAGWPAEQIEWAYKETMKHNYSKYLEKSTGSSPLSKTHYDRNKIMIITVFTILVLVGLFFLVKGVTTGQAIHFTSPQELDVAVKSLLTQAIDNNDFYPLVENLNLCIEVQDLKSVVSYRVIKTKLGHLVQPAPIACSADDSYDLALKFTNWDTFNVIARKTTCANIENGHEKLFDSIERGFYVLPSKYVLPGFKLNPAADYSAYCAVLKMCKTTEELAQAGMVCP